MEGLPFDALSKMPKITQNAKHANFNPLTKSPFLTKYD